MYTVHIQKLILAQKHSLLSKIIYKKTMSVQLNLLLFVLMFAWFTYNSFQWRTCDVSAAKLKLPS